jgi:hypothetical protein
MHVGALMAARQTLGHYLVYAKPWQRRLIVAGVVTGGAALLAAGIVTGHVAMAATGAVILLAIGSAGVRALRARRPR